MSRDDISDHRTRRLVQNYITVHPGVSFSNVQQIFELPESTLRYHLTVLEKSDVIRSKLNGNKRCYYPQGPRMATEVFPNLEPTTLTDLQGRLLTIVKANKDITIGELVRKTSLERRVLQYNIKILRDRGLVIKQGKGKKTSYEAISAEKLRKEMLRRLITKLLDGEIDAETYSSLREQIRRRER